jgi:hypothetical protein
VSAPRQRKDAHPAGVKPESKPPSITVTGPTGSVLSVQMDQPIKVVIRKLQMFVREERLRMSVPVRPGRQRGMIGIGIPVADAVILAYLYERRSLSKAELLRLSDRTPTSNAYDWLDRRIAVGRRKLHLPIIDEFDTWSLEALKKIATSWITNQDVDTKIRLR